MANKLHEIMYIFISDGVPPYALFYFKNIDEANKTWT